MDSNITTIEDPVDTPPEEEHDTQRPRDRRLAPVRKLTVDLIQTYKNINKVYYEKKKQRQAQEMKAKIANNGFDDENADYIIVPEEVIDNRYVVKNRIGKGSFGQVIRAFDSVERVDVAIKIIKSKKPFFHQAKTEIELLQFLNHQDPKDSWNVVKLKSTFVWRNHQCLVFEMLSYNLYDLLLNTNFKGVSLNLVRKFARQLLKSLAFLALPEIDIVHCDLKPENILLRNPKHSAIKLIDFGSSCRTKNRLYSYIQSRFYRSPEVMLGLPYDTAIDMWSLGCVLVELHCGEPLFSGCDEFDQMSRLVAIRGMPPLHMLAAGSKTKQFFSETPPATSPLPVGSTSAALSASGCGDGVEDMQQDGVAEGECSVPGTRFVLRTEPTRGSRSREDYEKRRRRNPPRLLEDVLGVHTGGPRGGRSDEPGHSPVHYSMFLDLVDRMLQFDPKLRIKPVEAANHPFFHQTQSPSAVGATATGSSNVNCPNDSSSAPASGEAAPSMASGGGVAGNGQG